MTKTTLPANALAAAALAAIMLGLTSTAYAAMGPIDANGDGVLSRAEFGPIEEMGASWVVFDANQDGVVSQLEFNQEAANLVSNTPNSLDRDQARDLDQLTAAFSNASEY